MSRNSSGVYTLPAGNPVVTGTPITIAWANGTLDDITAALTDSLSRTAQGGMTAALLGFDGTVSLPGFAFTLEPSSGLYRVSAGSLGVAVLGAQVTRFTATGLTLTGSLVSSGVLSAPVGSAALPSHTFTGDLNTGMSAAVGDTLVLSTAGTARLTLTSALALFSAVQTGPVGSAGTPTYSFTGDANTGMSAAVGDTLVLSTGGVARLTLTSSSALFGPVLSAPLGTAALPAYSFTGDLNTGMSAATADTLVLSVAGAAEVTITASTVTVGGTTKTSDGTVGAPAYSFTSDPNTGIYSPSTDELGFALGGTGYLVGFRNIPQVVDIDAYTLVITDSGKHIYRSSGNAATWTIPANASVAFPIGTAVTFVNDDANSDITIAITTDVMVLAGTTSTGNRTLVPQGIATALKVTPTRWIINGTGLS